MALIKNKALFLAICLILIGFFAYANTLPNKMFWDDDDFILQNQYIKDWQYTPNFFKENIIAGSGLHSNYWRPVLLGVFSVEWYLWEDWPVGYHAVNLIFHIANGLLLFFILHRLFNNYFYSFFPALIFLIHPLQTEAVSYVNGLGDSLSVFFMFVGLWLFIKAITNISKPYFKNWQYYISVLCYILALMCKETAIIMPALVGLVWWFSRVNEHFVFNLSSRLTLSASEGERRDPLTISDAFTTENSSVRSSLLGINRAIFKLIEILGLFIVMALVYIFLRATILNFGGTFNLYESERNLFVDSLGVRIFTYFRIFSVYLGLLFWPQTLHMERGVVWASNFAHNDVILGALCFALILVVGAWQFIKRRPLGFGLLWFLIALAPTSNILVPINGLLYEHWLYLPLGGFFIAVASLVCRVWQKFCHFLTFKYFVIAVLAIFIIGLVLRTIHRNLDWRDPITFYTKTLQHAPNSYRINNNLAMEYANRQNLDEAKKYYLRALNIEPNEAVVYYNLANLYVAQGKWNLAQENYELALKKDKLFWLVYPALINLFKATNQPKQAEKVYLEYMENSKKD